MAQLTATSARAAFVDLHDRAHPEVVHSVDFDSIFLQTDLASLVTGIATDGTFVYVTGTRNPSSGGGFLAIGQYNRPVDTVGFSPIIVASNIYDGAAPLNQSREGEIEVLAFVNDDIAIASIKIFVNDELVVTRNTASSRQWSGTLQAPIPLAVDSVTVTLEVTDVGGNVTSRTATLVVNPFLPSAFTSVGAFATLPGDIATDGRSVWITDPDNISNFRVLRLMANVDFKFYTFRGGTAPTDLRGGRRRGEWLGRQRRQQHSRRDQPVRRPPPDDQHSRARAAVLRWHSHVGGQWHSDHEEDRSRTTAPCWARSSPAASTRG